MFQNAFQKYFFISLAVLSVFIYYAVFSNLPSNNLNFYVLNIGQGDAIFIETPNGKQVLVDGGPDNKVLSELGAVMPFNDKTIDLVVLTHPQEDHLFGLIDVLKRYTVANVLMTGVVYKNSSYEELKKIIQEKNINVFSAYAGEKVSLDKNVTLDVLWPKENLWGQEFSDNTINDTSVALLLKFKQKKFLMMGDAEVKEEVDLINFCDLPENLICSKEDLDIDVLKLSHHGSKTSSSQLFLDRTTPELALASIGWRNRYYFPHQEIVDRLKQIPFFHTAQNGRIKVITDGVSLKVEKAK